MIIDTAAIIAILADEPEGKAFLETITNALRASISAATYVEISLVLERFPAHAEALDGLLTELDIDIQPVTVTQARLARDAFHAYGKGCHPAGLNYGDCFSYALAKASGEQLLFKGEDFSKTDVESVDDL